jgi:hypothetical protein
MYLRLRLTTTTWVCAIPTAGGSLVVVGVLFLNLKLSLQLKKKTQPQPTTNEKHAAL